MITWAHDLQEKKKIFASSSYELFVVSFMQENVYKPRRFNAHARFASLQLSVLLKGTTKSLPACSPHYLYFAEC